MLIIALLVALPLFGMIAASACIMFLVFTAMGLKRPAPRAAFSYYAAVPSYAAPSFTPMAWQQWVTQ